MGKFDTEQAGIAAVLRGNLDEGFQLIGPFRDWGSASSWAEDNPSILQDWVVVLQSPSGNFKWESDDVQFPRLLAEVHAVADTKLYNDLCESMDLTLDKVMGLFERAEHRWENIKKDTR